MKLLKRSKKLLLNIFLKLYWTFYNLRPWLSHEERQPPGEKDKGNDGMGSWKVLKRRFKHRGNLGFNTLYVTVWDSLFKFTKNQKNSRIRGNIMRIWEVLQTKRYFNQDGPLPRQSYESKQTLDGLKENPSRKKNWEPFSLTRLTIGFNPFWKLWRRILALSVCV